MENGYVCLGFDTFVLDNSGTNKEWVSRTYQGTDGYTPIAAYLGNEGWCLALELRPGSQHSASEPLFLWNASCRGRMRAWAEQGRRFDYLVNRILYDPRQKLRLKAVIPCRFTTIYPVIRISKFASAPSRPNSAVEHGFRFMLETAKNHVVNLTPSERKRIDSIGRLLGSTKIQRRFANRLIEETTQQT